MTQVLMHHGSPVAAYGSVADAMQAVLELPGWADPDLCIVGVPFNASLTATEGTVTAAAAGGCRASGTPGVPPVTLSPNGNKKE